MRFTVRELVFIGIFGALWGGIEISLGSILHTLNLPFSGLVLAAGGIAAVLIGRILVPRRGSVLFIGLVTALVKMLSLGGIVISPMIGILAESLLAEIALTGLGSPRRTSFMIAAGLATLWSLVHPFFTQGLLYGQGIWTVYGWILQRGASLLGLDPSAIVPIVAGLLAIHLLSGLAVGWLAWEAGRAVVIRLPALPSYRVEG